MSAGCCDPHGVGLDTPREPAVDGEIESPNAGYEVLGACRSQRAMRSAVVQQVVSLAPLNREWAVVTYIIRSGRYIPIGSALLEHRA
jgi:hypothetical protein